MRLVNEEGIVVNVNKAYCELFRMKRNELIGKPFNAAYVIRDSEKSLDSFVQRFRLRTIRNKFETDILLHDGTLIWVELTSAFIEIKNSPSLLLSIFRDITSYKKLINETIQAKEKAEEMNKVKSYFFANMSHELRTPLVGILGFADILREELEDNPELSKMAELITRSGQRLHETLNLILSLSKLEAGKLEVKITEENIIPHIKTSFNLFEQAAKKKELQYNLDLPDKPVFCRVDPNLIQNVLNNLINNAIKFTPKGSVTVKLDTIGSTARIQVIDTGIGIPKENHSVIWEEFRQVSEGLNRSFEGTGLGLTIVKRFTTLMGGKISLESDKDKGSKFILEFPLIDKKLDIELKEAGKKRENNGENLLTKNSFDLLYVEDDQASVDIVSLMLKGKYDFDIARSADEALMKVKQNSYRAILMDINLKNDTDGVQLTKLIRQLNGYGEIPIAAITAYALGKDREAFLSHGMTHYLSKPFSKNDLLELISRMLEE
jgi:PAS domain S-box-containing protein